MSTATRLMTAEEFYELAYRPESGDQWFELDEEKVVEFPLPGLVHGIVCASVGYHLGTYCFQKNPKFLATMRCGVIVSRNPDTVLGPDVSLFHNTKNWDELIAEHGYGDDVPHLVVEVLSPSDEQERIQRKIRQYLRGGVKLVWGVDPVAEDVIVHRIDAEPLVLGVGDTIDGGDLLPGFSCPVKNFFRLPAETD